MTTYLAADGHLHTTVTASSVARLLNQAGWNRRSVTLGYELDSTMGWLRLTHFDTTSNNDRLLIDLNRMGFTYRIESEFTDYDGVSVIEIYIGSRKVA